MRQFGIVRGRKNPRRILGRLVVSAVNKCYNGSLITQVKPVGNSTVAKVGKQAWTTTDGVKEYSTHRETGAHLDGLDSPG